jgi:hypothetical protein
MNLEKEAALVYACAVYFNINCTGRNLNEVFIKKKEALKSNKDFSFFVS